MKKIEDRLTQEEVRKRLRKQYPIPTLLLTLSAFCILVSIFLPYWNMEMQAPQYPDGLNVQLYVNKLSGDVEELDVLNHYIGMKSLEQGGTLERALSIYALITIALITIAAIFVHNRWVLIWVLPILLYPLIFVVDLFYWLNLFGQNLDPSAPLSSSVDPFTPPIFGSEAVANFLVVTRFAIGFYIACLAVVLAVLGLYFHRKIYKPLVDYLPISTVDIEHEEPVLVGATFDIVPHVLIEAVKIFRLSHPKIRMFIRSGHRSDVIKMVENREVSFGIIPGREQSKGLTFKRLFKYERVLITPLGHPLLKKPVKSLADIVKYPLILLEKHSYTRVLLEEEFANQGLEFQVVMELDSMDFIKQFVSIGMGVSIGPLLAIEQKDLEKLGVIKLDNLLMEDEGGVITIPGRPISNHSLAFISTFEESLLNNCT